MARPLKTRAQGSSGAIPPLPAERPEAFRRSEVYRRLQMGGIGVAGVLVLIALASFIEERAQISDRSAVPQASVQAVPAASTAGPDPLAQAGVVPDVPASANPPSGAAKSTGAPPERAN